MELQEYPIEELRAELKRRNALIKADRAKIMRCKHCVHYGEIDYCGNEMNESVNYITRSSAVCCRFHKTKNGKYYRCHQPYQIACEHFEPLKQKKS